jgi:hypothetical protein
MTADSDGPLRSLTLMAPEGSGLQTLHVRTTLGSARQLAMRALDLRPRAELIEILEHGELVMVVRRASAGAGDGLE